jgi:hypothetical protein
LLAPTPSQLDNSLGQNPARLYPGKRDFFKMDQDSEGYRHDASLHRTLVEFLFHSAQVELAAAMLEGWVEDHWDGKQTFFVEVPPSAYRLIASSEEMQEILCRAMREVAKGHSSNEKFEVEIRMRKLPAPDEAWNKEMKSQITQFKGSNQGLVSQIVASRDGRPVHTWNEMRYASKSEIAIAQELEERKILFFPLAVAVRAETKQTWKDHREVDFLICNNGAWGILEVAYHPDRYEKDSEKDHWFKKSGILCIQHYTAERCHKNPSSIVDEFLGILKQYEK